jgi:HK97 family phage portal protein
MGLLNDIKLWAAAKRYSPKRETLAYPKIVGMLGRGGVVNQVKPSPSNLRYFSRTPYARRAINAIKEPISALEWVVRPKSEFAKAKLAIAHAAAVTACLNRPNMRDGLHSLLQQVIEDALVCGAGVLEQASSNDPARPVWLWPVDGTTIKPLPQWDGRPTSTRFYQSLGYASDNISSDINAKKLEARDIVYMRMNPATDSPYGFGPLEIAYMSVARQLGVATYAANLASNAQPQNMIYAGAATQEELLAFRNYWRNEVEGQGQTPIIGNTIKADVMRLHAGSDDALYLKWQTFLIRELATAFGLSPQNLGLESDVNRNTSEVAEDRDWDQAIKPMAALIASHLNADVIAPRWPHLEFVFEGIDREDEKATADIFATYYASNVLTPNEQRAKLGMPPMNSAWADLCWADVQIAMKGAQGAKQIDDNQLPEPKPPAKLPTPGATGEPENGS